MLGELLNGKVFETDDHMRKTFSDLPNWAFEMDEVSTGVYEVIGQDSAGRRVSAKGVDLEELIHQCRANAKQYLSSIN